jgi:UDP-N-acetylglucosamine transferase subunit ALG13
MIFVTVGSQEPFDRLISAVDGWASSSRRSDVFAQIAAGTYCPQHVRFTRFLDPPEFQHSMREAKIVVAHAGMGSIIAALELGKPIVVMPRLARFRETRNDHQVAAAKHFGEQGRIIVARDEQELPEKLEYALTLGQRDRIDTQASPQLIATIRAFVDSDFLKLRSCISEDQVVAAAKAEGSGIESESSNPKAESTRPAPFEKLTCA